MAEELPIDGAEASSDESAVLVERDRGDELAEMEQEPDEYEWEDQADWREWYDEAERDWDGSRSHWHNRDIAWNDDDMSTTRSNWVDDGDRDRGWSQEDHRNRGKGYGRNINGRRGGRAPRGGQNHWYYRGLYKAKGKGKGAVRAYVRLYGPPPGRSGKGQRAHQYDSSEEEAHHERHYHWDNRWGGSSTSWSSSSWN